MNTALMGAAMMDWVQAINAKNGASRSTAFAVRMIAGNIEVLMRQVMEGYKFVAQRDIKRKKEKEQRMQVATKNLMMQKTELMLAVMSPWIRFTGDTKRERIEAAAAAELKATTERARQEKLKAIHHCFAKSETGMVILTTTCGSWKALYLQQKRRKQNLTAASKALGADAAAIQAAVLSFWQKDGIRSKYARASEVSEKKLRQALAGHKISVGILERTLEGTAQSMLVASVVYWRQEAEAAKIRKDKKNAFSVRIMNEFSQGEEKMKSLIFADWSKMTQADKDIAQERGRRRRAVELGRSIIILLRGRLAMRLAWDAWQFRVVYS
jgi:hypothetical protein